MHLNNAMVCYIKDRKKINFLKNSSSIGNTVTCPADVKQPNGFECRAAAGPCDVAEQVSLFVSTIISIYLIFHQCDGSTNNCPANAFQSSSSVCRPVAGACDVAETCSGSSASCPADSYIAHHYLTKFHLSLSQQLDFIHQVSLVDRQQMFVMLLNK